MDVLVTGATGLIGRRLCERLAARGDRVLALSRQGEAARARVPPGAVLIAGDPAVAGPWQERLSGVDAVVHLAGENVFGRRWNAAFKATLRDSRVGSTALVAAGIQRAPRPPRVLVSASAVGYYGLRRDEPGDESAASGDDFLARLCVDWEAAARRAPTRVVSLRVGVVLAKGGGALQKMLPPFRAGLGGPVGDGTQWVPWIHEDDMAAAILHALDTQSLSGPVNGVAPSPVTNRALSETLARRLHRPCLFPVPRLALKALFGEVADVMCGGQNLIPRALLASGFAFRHPELAGALATLLR